MNIYHTQHSRGFALVATVSMMVLMTLIAVGMLSLSTIEQRSSGGGVNDADRTARANARMALMIAIGELQKAAGPDQRVTATASILGSATNPYTTGTTAVNGRKHWVGIWDTSEVRRDVDGDGDIDNDDKTVDTNGDGEGDEFPPYSPADPDEKEFVRWLVSGDTYNPGDNLASLVAVSTAPATDDLVIFKGLNGAGILDDNAADSIKVPKVEVATATPGNTSYYAYWVEDEGVKADLAWNEMTPPDINEEDSNGLPIYPAGEADPQYIADKARWQAARLSNTTGPDYLAFDGTGAMISPFEEDTATAGHVDYQVTYPLLGFPTYDYNADGEIDDADNQNPWIANMKKAMSVADISLVMQGPTVQNTDNHSDWLKANRHDMAMNVRGVIADVKKGGLRRDLSLAFEMDGTEESENADLFNDQTTEFVGNGDQLSSPYNMPGMTLKARHLFRDYPSAGDSFSADITQPLTTVRGPSWWLLRDYANLYKRLKTSTITDDAGDFLYNTHEFAARPYFPNRTTPVDPTTTLIHPANSTFAEDLSDIHADNQWSNWKYGPIKGPSVNRETNNAGTNYAYRPVRANYAPVLLGVNAVYSLVYTGNQLKMVVDPFFIVWNPYNTQITADKFAVTLEGGFAGGMMFRVTDANGTITKHGWTDPNGYAGRYGGSDTYFVNYAKNKSGGSGELSYLINGLSMKPGEVMIYSPPNEAARNANANVLHDELLPGFNYNATDSGIFFDKFPNDKKPESRWWVYDPNLHQVWDTIPGSNGAAPEPVIDANSKIEILFNVCGQNGAAIVNIIETNMPSAGSDPEDLTTEESYGNNVSAQEYRLNLGGGKTSLNIDKGQRYYTLSYNFSELSGTKKSFGILSMLTMPTDFVEADTKMEPFSQLNATPMLRTQLERFSLAPLNIVVKTINANGINNLMNQVGVDIDAFGSGDNGFYGKSYSLAEGDTKFPLIDIPKAPLHSLVQLSGANIGTRLFEPTHAIGNSWKPPYVPWDSVYDNNASYMNGWYQLTMNDVSWQANDALFDRYFLSGIAPDFNIGAGGYTLAPLRNKDGTIIDNTPTIEESIKHALSFFYGSDPAVYGSDSSAAKANPVLEPYIPTGMTAADVISDLDPDDDQYDNIGSTPDPDDYYDGYKKIGAYSMVKGAFNVNSTSVQAWRAFLQGNKTLALESVQGTNDVGIGTPFPLGSTTSNTSSNNGWEKFSRLTDAQIWDDNSTPNDLTDDTGLAVEIVNQVKARGPFMSFSDFVNRRIGANTDLRTFHGAMQEAIEQAGINGNQSTGIRSSTSDIIPNYSNYGGLFPFADGTYLGSRNNATGVPLEVNQANILLPLAPRLSARSDTFRIRAYGEVRDADDKIIAQATCEAVVQRLPEYMDAETDPNNNEPWDDDSETPTLNAINQTYGRKFEIQSFRWLDQSEV